MARICQRSSFSNLEVAGGYLECESNHWMIGRIPTKPGASVLFYYDPPIGVGRLESRLAITPDTEQHARVSDQRRELGETTTNAANFRLPKASRALQPRAQIQDRNCDFQHV